MTTTITVNVAISANGATPGQGVTFKFTPGPNMPAGVFSSDGSLDFSQAFAKGTAITLVFSLQTTSLTFGANTYPLNLFGQQGPTNVCWISLTKPPPGPYSGSEFTFAPGGLPPGYGSVSIIDNNNDGNTYYYELFVWLGGAAGLKFGHDPHIINHSSNT